MVDMKQFTSEGHKAYKKWLLGMKTNPKSSINRSLQDMTEDFRDSNGNPVELNIGKAFETALEFAAYLFGAFSGTNDERKATVFKIMENERAADWLIYIYFKQLCAKKTKGKYKGKYKVGELARYELQLGGRQKIYRHLIAGRLAVYATYPNITNPEESLARLCLTHKPEVFSRAMDVISSTEEIFFNENMMKILNKLYWDETLEKPKTNTTANEHPLADGCLYRFMGPNSFYDQHYLTHDFRSMSEDEIITLMKDACGEEFDTWLDNTAPGDGAEELGDETDATATDATGVSVDDSSDD